MKKYFFTLIIILLFIIFLSHHLQDGKEFFSLILVAKWWYLILAMVFQIIYYTSYSLIYKKSFEIFGIRWNTRKILILFLASLSAGISTPLGAWAGTAIFIHNAKKEQLSRFSAGAGIFTAILFDFLILFLFLTLGMFILIYEKKLYSFETTGYIIFILILLAFAIPLILSFYNPDALIKLLKNFMRILNFVGRFIKHKTFFSEDWLKGKELQLRNIYTGLMKDKQSLRIMLLNSLVMHTVNMLSIFICFLAFGYLINPLYLFVSYGFGRLFLVISPTPQGIGVVDSLLPIIFNSFGIDMNLAILVTLAYRGLSLWLPVFLGFWALHKVMVKE